MQPAGRQAEILLPNYYEERGSWRGLRGRGARVGVNSPHPLCSPGPVAAPLWPSVFSSVNWGGFGEGGWALRACRGCSSPGEGPRDLG